LVQIAEGTENGQPDVVAGYLSGPGSPYRLLDLLSENVQRVVIDVTSPTGAPHTSDHLRPAERLFDSTTFDDVQDGRLDCGEPTITLCALPTPADRLPFFRLARIDDAGIRV